jgi:exonuclease SbcD
MPTLLHTADWHLGKQLHGKFDLHSVHHAMLTQLLGMIDDTKPDVLVLAGDLFDHGERPSLDAIDLWTHFSGEIAARKLPIVLIPGNHDQAKRMALNANLARNAGLHLVNALAAGIEPFALAGIEFTALPYHRPTRVRQLAQQLQGEDAPNLGDFDDDAAMRYLTQQALARSSGELPRVAVAHAFVLGGDPEGFGEDPLTVGGAGGVHPSAFDGFDYTALGHLHRPAAVGGRPHVRYAGSLYPCAFDEAHAKSVTLVRWEATARAGTAPHIETLDFTPSQRVRVIEDQPFEQLLQAGEAARARGDASVHDFLLARVTDRDPIPFAQERLSAIYPNAVLEQRALAVATGDSGVVVDAQSATLESLFLAFYRHLEGEEATLSDLEQEILNEAIASLQNQGAA